MKGLMKNWEGMKMPRAIDVANFFLAKGGDGDGDGGISNLKLQKLVYYAQGFHAAITGNALFHERIEAWAHGPVVPELYHHFKHNGRNPIPAPAGFNGNAVFSAEQIELLEEVYDVFGQFSAWRLREMTHEEKPWLDHEEAAEVIPIDEMRQYFRTRLR